MNHHGILHRHSHLGAYNAARLLVFLDGLHDLLVPPDQTDDPQRIDHVVIWDNDRVPLLQAMEEACCDVSVEAYDNVIDPLWVIYLTRWYQQVMQAIQEDEETGSVIGP
ncbi:unnamed protein product [Pleuronectes platessa]|uniref:Uncharacterized protein n=1 Tax=Pleuronectes platessa TaxID=8262 RepID=A0A9N7YSA4_PLEPL|nr:unnamed protein product [Pleuronectes platessa]